MLPAITASGSFHNHQLENLPVINPGGWFGKTWLLEIGGSYWPLFLVVEADTVSDAIDELADNATYGHQITVDPDDLAKYPDDYPEDSRHYGPLGHVLDLDWLSIHGHEGAAQPWRCTYHADGLPPEGANPTEFCWDDFPEPAETPAND
jgi:hypothetical protein